MTGVFVAVVGASGAGKDSVLDVARNSFTGDPTMYFPRRVITRPKGPGEDHLAVSDTEFQRLAVEEYFVVSWRAHGLAYGIRQETLDRVTAGAIAVVNTSRTVLSELPLRFPRSAVVRITASDEVRRARLQRRGREEGGEVSARMLRPDPAPDYPVDLTVVNEGSVQESGRLLTEFLRSLR